MIFFLLDGTEGDYKQRMDQAVLEFMADCSYRAKDSGDNAGKASGRIVSLHKEKGYRADKRKKEFESRKKHKIDEKRQENGDEGRLSIVNYRLKQELRMMILKVRSVREENLNRWLLSFFSERSPTITEFRRLKLYYLNHFLRVIWRCIQNSQ